MFTIGPSNTGNSNALPKKRPKADEVNQEDTTTVTGIKKVKSDSFLPEGAKTPLQPKPLVRNEGCNSFSDLLQTKRTVI